MSLHPHIATLLECIDLEEKEQVKRFRLDEQHSLKILKAEGLALHPISVTRKSFGYAEYPEISFRLPYPAETTMFRDGSAIECFLAGEESVKGVLMSLDGKSGEFRLFAPDFPDWIEDDNVGIKLAPDTRTTGIMKKVLSEVERDKKQLLLFQQLHGESSAPALASPSALPGLSFGNQALNPSQQSAVASVIANNSVMVIHGPPGTGKTTTLVEAILQLTRQGKKVLVSAPSNTAVDNIVKGLLAREVKALRVGNVNKVDEAVFRHTPEGKMVNSREQKEIKQLRIRAEEFRKMALKYKRSFGKAEREQRNLLFKEVKSIRTEIRKLQEYYEQKLFAEADVIAGTPVGIYDNLDDKMIFDTLVIDEAGQCIEPLAWCILSRAERIVLAGDHWQLPPTVISNEAAIKGFNLSILEVAVKTSPVVTLLDTQYRMRQAIAGFSSLYFYNNLLKTAEHLSNQGSHLSLVDTAGSGFQETRGNDGTSLQNQGELNIARQLIGAHSLEPSKTAFISPYAGQVAAAKEMLPAGMRMSTVDSFQGQEQENIIVSLVRSNDEGDIGFLKDYRRMNVAITRAKEQLFVIGDSATIGNDPFYRSFLEYIEKNGEYRSAWEFDLT